MCTTVFFIVCRPVASRPAGRPDRLSAIVTRSLNRPGPGWKAVSRPLSRPRPRPLEPAETRLALAPEKAFDVGPDGLSPLARIVVVDPLDMRAADRAQLVGTALHQAQLMHACAAEFPVALRAMPLGPRAVVPLAAPDALGHLDGLKPLLGSEGRHRHAFHRPLDQGFHLSEAEALAGPHAAGGLNPLIVDERPVGGLAIAHAHEIQAELHFTMM